MTKAASLPTFPAPWVPISDTAPLPLIPAGLFASADVLVLVEYTDGSGRDWLKGNLFRTAAGHRWHVPSWKSITILAWQPGPELPGAKR